MKPVWTQDVAGRSHQCLEAALASFLEVPVADVPPRRFNSADGSWTADLDRLTDWLAERFYLRWTNTDVPGYPPGWSLASGHQFGEPPGFHHVVVCHGGWVVHDPSAFEVGFDRLLWWTVFAATDTPDSAHWLLAAASPVPRIPMSYAVPNRWEAPPPVMSESQNVLTLCGDMDDPGWWL